MQQPTHSKMIQNCALTLPLLSLMGFFGWYGVCSQRIDDRDLVFVQKYQSTEYFPITWLWHGNVAYYVDLDETKALESYHEAISRQPILVEAWIALAKAELMQGKKDKALGVLELLDMRLERVSTWKWQQLLLAFDLEEETRFAAAFNFILSRLPQRISEACFLAKRFWGSWKGIVPHVDQDNCVLFLRQCVESHETEAALALWEKMERTLPQRDEALALGFCHFLINENRLTDALRLWRQTKKNQAGLIYNGDMEQEPLNAAFGWRFRRHKNVTLERSVIDPHQGAYSLHLHFRGTANVDYHHVRQIVPVTPERAYRLSFAQRSRNLTTDQGVFLEVTSYGCDGLSLRSTPLTGDQDWKTETINVAVPDGCEAIHLLIRRNESLMFDSKISGDYWLDSVQLEPLPDTGV